MRQSRGFSVIEMLVVVVLMGLILTAMLSFLLPGFRAWILGDHHATLQQDGVLAVLALSKDVAQIPITTAHATPGTTFDPLQNATTETDTLTFASPLDPNEDIAFEPVGGDAYLRRFVRYSVDPQWQLVAWSGFLPATTYTNTNDIRLAYPDYQVKVDATTWKTVAPISVSLRVVARQVHRFGCTVATQGTAIMGQTPSTNPVRIDLLTKDPLYEYEIQTDVSSVLSN